MPEANLTGQLDPRSDAQIAYELQRMGMQPSYIQEFLRLAQIDRQYAIQRYRHEQLQRATGMDRDNVVLNRAAAPQRVQSMAPMVGQDVMVRQVPQMSRAIMPGIGSQRSESKGFFGKVFGKLVDAVKGMFTLQGLGTMIGIGVIGTLTGTLPLIAVAGTGFAAMQTGMSLLKSVGSKSREETTDHLSDAAVSGIFTVLGAFGAKQSLKGLNFKDSAGVTSGEAAKTWGGTFKHYVELFRGRAKTQLASGEGATFWGNIADTTATSMRSVRLRMGNLFSNPADKAKAYKIEAEKIAAELADPAKSGKYSNNYKEQLIKLQGKYEEKASLLTRRASQDETVALAQRASQQNAEMTVSEMSVAKRIDRELYLRDVRAGKVSGKSLTPAEQAELDALYKLRADEYSVNIIERYKGDPSKLNHAAVDAEISEINTLLGKNPSAENYLILKGRLRGLKNVKQLLNENKNPVDHLANYKAGVEGFNKTKVDMTTMESFLTSSGTIDEYLVLQQRARTLAADSAELKAVNDQIAAIETKVADFMSNKFQGTHDLNAAEVTAFLERLPASIRGKAAEQIVSRFTAVDISTLTEAQRITFAQNLLQIQSSSSTGWGGAYYLLSNNLHNGKILTSVSTKSALDSFAAFDAGAGDQGEEQ